MRVHVPQDHMMEPQAYIGATYAPKIAAAGLAFSKATYEHSRLPLRVFEAARAHTAQINGCQACQAWRSGRDADAYVKTLGGSDQTVVKYGGEAPDEAFYQAIGEWKTSPMFTDAERLAVEYAEGLGLDPQGTAENEALWARLKATFTDDQIVDLTYCILCWVAMGRAAHVLGIDDACQIPTRLQSVAA